MVQQSIWQAIPDLWLPAEAQERAAGRHDEW